ncbi:carboxymuconolactone decarboxylase family protein [Umezawaea sp.]|uniref:carboxymuconolactone decarboxylase family protein n=1 Tax=Umezawaea sp. TaxID=1955258 RepID=UPI002ED4338C
MFTDHTTDTAPPAARKTMTAIETRVGRLPPAVARMAESPELLDGFLRSSGLFDASTLDPVAREVVVMTMATRNPCHVCVAVHTAKLRALDADEDLVVALTGSGPLPDERLDALRTFTLEVLRTGGEVDDDTLTAFLRNGHTRRNALEVVLGIGAYTMSTLANRMTRAPL